MVGAAPPYAADIVIVGGGPAGLAAALAAHRQGLKPVVIDRRAPPLDKACGEGLMPDAIAALAQLGIELDRDDGMEFRGIRFIDGALSASAGFGGMHGLGVRRTRLHRRMIERAVQLGIPCLWRRQARLGDDGGIEIDGQAVACRWIVGADGIHSRLRKRAGIATKWQTRPRVGVRQHFRIRPWSDHVEVHWRHRAQAYVTPVGANEVCVVLMGDAPGPRFADLAALFPDLAARLGDATASDAASGAISACAVHASPYQGNLALVGDASGSVDAITGEGLGQAFRQALALSQALAHGDLAAYAGDHRRIGRMPRTMARLLLAAGGHDRVRHGALRLLAVWPGLFDQLLALHTGHGQVPALAATAATMAKQSAA